MAMSAKFSLKLLVDEKRNKVVLAEAGHDFVDVLFGLLTLPMGTIARLLEQHQKLPKVLSCYKNLNKSVADMVVDDFQTQACQSMLMHPKSTKEIYCRELMLNIDDSQPTEFYVCPKFCKVDSCRKAYSNFNTSICSCGSNMNRAVEVPEDVQVIGSIGNDVDGGVFVKSRSYFIVTDDMKVMLNTFDEIFKVVSDLGYSSLCDMREMVLQVGYEEVLTLLGSIFSSDSALTCTFLKKQPMTTLLKLPPMLKTEPVEQDKGCSVKVIFGKLDKKILYAECSEDFIDSLVTFLVLPLELASSLSNDSNILGCVKNLCNGGCRKQLAYSSGLLGYYSCSKNLLGINSCPSPAYECSSYHHFRDLILDFVRPIERNELTNISKAVTVNPMDPKIPSSETINPKVSVPADIGFVKRKTKFIVSDDLTITSMYKFSTIGLLKKMKVNMNDIEARSICIYKAELINILKASLTSSSALTNGLSTLVLACKGAKERELKSQRKKLEFHQSE